MTRNATGTLRRRPPGWRPGLCTCLALTATLLAQGAPPADPLPAPEYSFDVGSPSVDEGYVLTGDVLTLDFPHPATALSGMALGLWSRLDDIDALSAGNATVSTEDVFTLLFSVDRLTVGAAAPDPLLIAAGVPYNAQDQSGRGHAGGDQFFSTELFSKLGQLDPLPGAVLRNNFLSRNNFDEGGVDFSAYPPTHAYTELEGPTPQDRVNAAARLARHGPEESVECLYFSLSPESPSLETLAGGWEPSGAHIFFALDRAALRGACCFDDSTCELLTEAECYEAFGIWLGPDTTCDMCPPPTDDGACCYFDGTCEITGPQDCPPMVGIWLGPNTTCDMCDVPEEGACCYFDGTCEITMEFECGNAGAWAIWLGPGTTCDMCPSMEGACCYFDGTCEITTMEGCIDGRWLGPETTCDMCDDPPEGACCYFDETCEITGPNECVDGIWLGPDTTCDMCGETPMGACCYFDGTCEITGPNECVDGIWLGPETTCEMCEELGGAMIVLPYASHEELGLVQADNIDALVVFDADEDGWFGGEDLVLFSLAPGSPSLSTIPGASAHGAAADVFFASPGSPPAVFAAAGELGLGAPADNIDALDLYIYGGRSSQAVQHGIRLLPGDMNSDGSVNAADIAPFVAALCGRDSFAEVCPEGNWNNADCNRDGDVNIADISAFVELLAGCPYRLSRPSCHSSPCAPRRCGPVGLR